MSYLTPNHIYFSNRAAAYLVKGDFHDCIEDCKSATKINPEFGKAWFRMAKAHQNLGNLDHALRSAETGVKYDESIQELIEKIKREIN